MRLSEAILLGSTVLKPRAYAVISEGEGCALGMALYAHGARSTEEAQAMARGMKSYSWLTVPAENPGLCDCDIEIADQLLAWQRAEKGYNDNRAWIVHYFNQHVCAKDTGKLWTLEQLVDWIRSVEPEEVEAVRVLDSAEIVTEGRRPGTSSFGQETLKTQ